MKIKPSDKYGGRLRAGADTMTRTHYGSHVIDAVPGRCAQCDNNNENNVYDVIIWIHHVKSLVTMTTMTEKQAGILNCETCDHERFGRENPDPDIYV